MIGFRYHVVSLAAVLLAVALGVLLGATQLSGAVGDDLRGQVRTLSKDNADLKAQVKGQQARVRSDDTVTSALAPKLVAGALRGQKVVVVATAQATDATTEGVTKTLEAAGAKITGRVQLTDDYADPRRAADARSYVTGGGQPAGFQLPETDDAGVLSGALLAYGLLGDADEDPSAATTSEVLSGFASLRMLRVESPSAAPADLAVVVGGGPVAGADPAARLTTLTALTGALDDAGRGVVVVGPPAAGGLVGAVRKDGGLTSAVSTVDDADRPVGQVATVFALAQQAAGRSGQYGTGAGVDGPFPPMSSS